MLTSFLAIFLKLITNPALLAGLIAFLQKSLHPYVGLDRMKNRHFLRVKGMAIFHTPAKVVG